MRHLVFLGTSVISAPSRRKAGSSVTDSYSLPQLPGHAYLSILTRLAEHAIPRRLGRKRANIAGETSTTTATSRESCSGHSVLTRSQGATQASGSVYLATCRQAINLRSATSSVRKPFTQISPSANTPRSASLQSLYALPSYLELSASLA